MRLERQAEIRSYRALRKLTLSWWMVETIKGLLIENFMAGRRVDLRGTRLQAGRPIMIHGKSNGGLHHSSGSQDGEERTDLTVLTGMHPPFLNPFSPTQSSDLRVSGMPSLPPRLGRFPYNTIA